MLKVIINQYHNIVFLYALMYTQMRYEQGFIKFQINIPYIAEEDMKKKLLYITLIAVAVLISLFGFMDVAFADEPKFSVRVNPTSVLGPQNVNITIDILTVGEDINDVVLYKASTKLEEYGTIIAGEAKKYTGSVSVSEAEIGDNKLVFTMTYSMGGQSKQIVVKKSVVKKAPTQSLDKSFSVDRAIIPEGQQIGFLFTFVNTGTKTISDLKVRDSNLNGGSWLSGGITVAAGETRIISFKHTMSKNITVKPELRYTVGGKTYDESFTSKDLKIVDDDVEVTVEASTTTPAPGEEVKFTVRMKNNGNVYLKNLKLYNHNNELVRLSGSILRSGDAASAVTYAVFKESDSVQFDITAEDSYGSVYSHASNIIEISVPIDFNPDDLTISAEPEFTSLAEPGLATFDVLLTNNSEYGLYDIRIIDTRTGDELATIPHLEKGERLVRVETQINESRDISFEVEAFDADENLHSADTNAEPISMTVLGTEPTEAPAEATATPEPSAPPGTTQNFFDKMSTWVIALIVIGVLILIVIISLSALVSKEKARQRGAAPPAPKKEMIKGSSVPRKRPKAPKKRKNYKGRGNIRVSYRDKNNF